MARISEQAKARALEKVFLRVKQSPNGISEQELADATGIHRRTVNNYLNEMRDEGKVERAGILWFLGDFDEVRSLRLEVTPEEAYTYYLGSRLLVKQHDKRNQLAEAALLKLADALAANKLVGSEISQAAQDLARRPGDPIYETVFQSMVRGYLQRKRVELTYKPLNGKPFSTIFETYLMEPSAIGYSTYVIGHSSLPNARRAYKLERIIAAELLNEEYRIPSDFPGLEVLRNSWSIIMGDEVVKVELRFSPQVRERVLETQWHPSQEYSDDPEKTGWLRWWIYVAGTVDIEPWVRSWGSDVEVLGPTGLRTAVKREALRLVELYHVSTPNDQNRRFYAHSKPDIDESDWQLLKDHLTQTGDLAYELGRDAGVSELARLAGVMHDIGKYSQAFQARLRGSNKPVDHATAGAKEVVTLYPNRPESFYAELLSYCIAGHHSGLPDYGSLGDVDGEGTLLARIKKKKLKDYSAYASEINVDDLKLQPLQIKLTPGNPGFSISFLTRMIFSTLVDADWLETERYMLGSEKPRGQYAGIDALAEEFNLYLRQFENPRTPINQKRTEILRQCLVLAASVAGFFTLTVPTGGGKTLASMAFALNHAIANGLKRVIYVIPFTSIIEQNAGVFRESLGALGEQNILEHHSNFDWETLRSSADDDAVNLHEKLRLAAENWDIPIVVTTNVQFFESLFANKKSRARKLHNIAKSVIIFDEAQTLPREYLKPCLLAVQELVRNYGASALFCTATQPSLQRFFPADTTFTELAPNPQQLFDFFRRVQVKERGVLPDEDLLNELETHHQVLCIVNTRRHAKGLFDQLTGEGRFHLSTLMCPVHRKEVLTEIRSRLSEGKTCRVISTQVMEAGIDVDFPIGYRALAGLDSVIQAAGRINREAKAPSGDMLVFEPKTEFIKRTPTFVAQTGSVAKGTLREFDADPTSIAAIDAYYNTLYSLQGENAFDAKQILNYFDKKTREPNFDFKTAAENFKLIDDDTVAIIIPFDEEAKSRLRELRYTRFPTTTLRKLQVYTVNVYEREFLDLQSLGAIQTVADVCHVLDEDQMQRYYHPQTGLILPERRGGEAVFFD